LQELTDRLDEVEYKADNPDEQWDPHALRDTVSELVDEYVRDNLADAVQEYPVGNRGTVDSPSADNYLGGPHHERIGLIGFVLWTTPSTKPIPKSKN
jgi:hypothetical protein